MKPLSVSIVLALTGLAHAQTWEPVPDLPTGGVAKTHCTGLVWNGRIYSLGGPPWTNGIEDGSVFSFSPGDGAWIEELGFDGIGPILGQGAGVDSMNRILVFNGVSTQDPTELGPTFVWEPVEGPGATIAEPGLLAPREFMATATDDDGRIYTLGGGPGESASAGAPNSAHAERFLGSTSTWEAIAPLPVATGDAAACYDGLGHILVFGGISGDGSTRLSEVQSYDIAAGTWSTSDNADIPVPLSAHRAVLGADGRILVMGGVAGDIGSGVTQSAAYTYDPVTDQWTPAPFMSVPRKWFGVTLGPDDRIYAIGGDNDSGGTSTAESIFTTTCPIIVQDPSDATIWRGQTFIASALVGGGGTLTYQWSRDGVDLVDGLAPGGGVISGASTPTLTVTDVNTADAGAYSLFTFNTCGSAVTTPAFLDVRVPPSVPTQWNITSLHTSIARHTYATGIDDDVQVGYGVWDTPEYNNIDHPLMWQGSAVSVRNLTPPGSQGGSVNSVNPDTLTGWWWQPFQCYVSGQWLTCYYRRGCLWTPSGAHRSYSWSGWEYSIISDSNGQWHVGTVTNDDDVGNTWSHAMIWSEPNLWPIDLHPGSAYQSSSLSAIDGEHQYGSAWTPQPGTASHAAMWSGTAASFVDLNPPGASNSSIADASDGQAVGSINLFNNPHAGIWGATPESFVDLTPAGATSSTVVACESGLQLGSITFSDHTSPVIWRGSASDYVELDTLVRPPYSVVAVTAMDVAPDGTITLVGNGYNSVLERFEALLITPSGACNAADFAEPLGTLDFSDVAAFLGAFGAMDPAADLVPPFGSFDFSDVVAFLTMFAASCP